MGLLNTYRVGIKGWIEIEAYSEEDARQAAEDKLAGLPITIWPGETYQMTSFR